VSRQHRLPIGSLGRGLGVLSTGGLTADGGGTGRVAVLLGGPAHQRHRQRLLTRASQSRRSKEQARCRTVACSASPAHDTMVRAQPAELADHHYAGPGCPGMGVWRWSSSPQDCSAHSDAVAIQPIRLGSTAPVQVAGPSWVDVAVVTASFPWPIGCPAFSERLCRSAITPRAPHVINDASSPTTPMTGGLPSVLWWVTNTVPPCCLNHTNPSRMMMTETATLIREAPCPAGQVVTTNRMQARPGCAKHGGTDLLIGGAARLTDIRAIPVPYAAELPGPRVRELPDLQLGDGGPLSYALSSSSASASRKSPASPSAGQSASQITSSAPEGVVWHAAAPFQQSWTGPSALQAGRLLEWAAAWPERAWAVEGAGGLGHLLAQQLVASGGRVLDVQPRLAARVRLLGAEALNKNDPNDARSVAVTALRSRSPREVAADDHSTVLKVWSRRHRDLGRSRTQIACRLHSALCELVPGGIGKEITAAQRSPGPGAGRAVRCRAAGPLGAGRRPAR